MLEAVIFDMNGVIVDDAEYNRIKWMEFLIENNRKTDDLQSVDGRRSIDIMKDFFPDKTENEIEELMKAKREIGTCIGYLIICG